MCCAHIYIYCTNLAAAMPAHVHCICQGYYAKSHALENSSETRRHSDNIIRELQEHTHDAYAPRSSDRQRVCHGAARPAGSLALAQFGLTHWGKVFIFVDSFVHNCALCTWCLAGWLSVHSDEASEMKLKNERKKQKKKNNKQPVPSTSQYQPHSCMCAVHPSLFMTAI